MTTSSRLAIAYPRGTQFIDETGRPTREFASNYEALLYRVNRITNAAASYTSLDPGTATPADIAAALNTLMAAITEA